MTRAWGSDAVALLLRELRIPYIALNPGASYRGLHDSLVNVLGNEGPEILVCLHEDHVIALAHGYAKVTETPLLAAVHSNVGLMHASMGIFNAFVDRKPVVILGANGPVDAAQRRPWIDWIHTTQDTGALVRGFTKWDDQPGSIPAALESILRAHQIARTPPYGPVYVCLDAGLQEAPLAALVPLPDPGRFAPPLPARPGEADLERAAGRLHAAQRPFILAGRVSRSPAAWAARVELAETLGAEVVVDRRFAIAFPTEHPCYAGALRPQVAARLRTADVVLSLDFPDLAGALRQAWPDGAVPATVISCTQDRYVHNGWSKDHQALPPVDLEFPVAPEDAVGPLLAALRARPARPARTADEKPERPAEASGTHGAGRGIGVDALAGALREATAGRATTFIHLAHGIDIDTFPLRHPLDYLGQDGGGGLGSGPGIAVGAALALRGTGRLPLSVIGDGDYLMGLTAIWTAVAHGIPLLVVVANNRSYFNDVEHQERIAVRRERPVERKWIGQRIDNPAPNLAGLARDQGAIGVGPIGTLDELGLALRAAIADVDAGGVCVLDVLIATH